MGIGTGDAVVSTLGERPGQEFVVVGDIVNSKPRRGPCCHPISPVLQVTRSPRQDAMISSVGSSIDLLVPSAHPIVGEWYDTTLAAADGMPPHVTLLWPWVSSPTALTRLDEVLAKAEPFEVVFSNTGRFPGVAYLAPEPRRPLLDLMRIICAAFPDMPPYGGELDHEPVPHLTAAKGDDEAFLDEIDMTLRHRLREPLTVRVDRISVSAKGVAPDGRWGVVREVQL